MEPAQRRETPRHPADRTAAELLQECNVKRTRRSGPGGQNRNKVETAIVLRHRPTGLESQGSERRSQLENQQAALARLRVKLALEVRVSRPQEAIPSALWRSRCRNGRISVSADHSDFPSLLAEALDVIAQADGDVKTAARDLACTSSQLVGFLQKEPRGLTFVNEQRQSRGLSLLR